MANIIVMFISIMLVLIVAAIGSLPVFFWERELAMQRYMSLFFILIAIQLFVGRLWNYFTDRKTNLELKKIEAANNLAESVQHTELTCAYCNTKNIVIILLNQSNYFDCESCKQKNLILIEMSSARITEPIMPKAELANIFRNIDKTDTES